MGWVMVTVLEMNDSGRFDLYCCAVYVDCGAFGEVGHHSRGVSYTEGKQALGHVDVCDSYNGNTTLERNSLVKCL